MTYRAQLLMLSAAEAAQNSANSILFQDLTTDPAVWMRAAAICLAVGGSETQRFTISDDIGLAAFLKKYPDGSSVTVVRPDRRRQGLAHKLFTMAQLDFSKQTVYTTSGRACVEAFQRKQA
jgi:hypothetical protein